jgi:hypothetical protein
MQAYVGTKIILAEPMNEYVFLEKYRGKERKKEDVKHEDVKHKENTECVCYNGYHVRYSNPDGSYYDSWSPIDVFLRAYRPITEDEKSLIV